MKFTLAVLATMMLTGHAIEEQCDAENFYAEYYTDPNCLKLDIKMTTKYGRVKEEMAYQWKQQCNNILLDDSPGKNNSEYMSYKIWCDKSGLHQELFDNKYCKDKGKSDYLKKPEDKKKYGECYDDGSWIFYWNNC